MMKMKRKFSEENNPNSQCKCEKMLHFYESENLNQDNHRFSFHTHPIGKKEEIC